jgi:hypothetical protein
MSTKTIKALAAAIGGLTISLSATAAVTFNYTGNPFDLGESSTDLGRHVTATVTFEDSVLGYTGLVDASRVLTWAIRVAEIPDSEMGSATGAVVDDWPLYFVFENGAISEWQVLARPAPVGVPEIYTTRNSPYDGILPTGDNYYPASYAVDGHNAYNEATPGVWAVVAVPESGTYALMLAGLALLGAASRHRKG